mgnify:CR=1 FL=1
MNKYIILFPITGGSGKSINEVMDKISAITHTEQPYKKMLPHITFHRPIKGVDEEKLVNFNKVYFSYSPDSQTIKLQNEYI